MVSRYKAKKRGWVQWLLGTDSHVGEIWEVQYWGKALMLAVPPSLILRHQFVYAAGITAIVDAESDI